MQTIYTQLISKTLSIAESSVSKTIDLLNDGATIPFISRYRKEITGGLDEVAVSKIKQLYEKFCELTKRKETILKAIDEQGKLTPELKSKIENCWYSVWLEDIYLPYKPKKHTRAEIAREKGLEPLAKILMAQREKNVYSRVEQFLSDEVENADLALQGARDIIAEWISERRLARALIRKIFRKQAVITSKVIEGKEEEGAKYRDYFSYSEPLSKCSSYRLLAMRRGEAEKILRVSISPGDDNYCIEALTRHFVRKRTESSAQVEIAVKDCYKRLLKPSIETEFAAFSKEKADEQAIKVFAENLRQLLLAPPLGPKRVMGVDPGYRTGCKVVCLDATGNLLHNETIYPNPPQNEKNRAGAKIISLISAYAIDAIAVGNGTASRETEDFLTHLRYNRKLQIFVVSEDGASIYSASKTAREEFPAYDVTVRGAVSIGRRLLDPLSELVKIDPKSIGVGQYQHDVDQTGLKQALDQTVESCVNLVGVNLNTASKYLLTYVSGLGPSLAQNIVDYRAKNGAFKSRKDLLKVPRLGKKAYEQAAGFLRIPEAANPLDNSAVHPESYHVVEAMAKDLNCTISDIIKEKTWREKIQPEKYVSEKTGMPTLLDIMAELDKPGRDPRNGIKVFEFDHNIRNISDLKEGMILPGIVNNITNFGCFVDIGLKEKGLVHISEMADRFVSDPTKIVALHQHVKVKVLNIDAERKRIQLSLKND
jgi:uncharacterized protein